jgi:hypothetical protein
MIEDTFNTNVIFSNNEWFAERERDFSAISIGLDFNVAYYFSWNRRRQRKKNKFKRLFFLKRVKCLHWLAVLFRESFFVRHDFFLKTCIKLNGIVFKYNYFKYWNLKKLMFEELKMLLWVDFFSMSAPVNTIFYLRRYNALTITNWIDSLDDFFFEFPEKTMKIMDTKIDDEYSDYYYYDDTINFDLYESFFFDASVLICLEIYKLHNYLIFFKSVTCRYI